MIALNSQAAKFGVLRHFRHLLGGVPIHLITRRISVSIVDTIGIISNDSEY